MFTPACVDGFVLDIRVVRVPKGQGHDARAACCAACAAEPMCKASVMDKNDETAGGIACHLKASTSGPEYGKVGFVSCHPKEYGKVNGGTLADQPRQANYTIDLGSATAPFKHAWEECVGSGHASLSLRSDWRQHLTRCQRELGFKRTRFHGLLDDDFSISLGENKNSYVNLDSLIDFHSSIGMVPLFELSFMPGIVFVLFLKSLELSDLKSAYLFVLLCAPAWLASNTSHTTCHYKGITSPPTDYTKWGTVSKPIPL